MHSRLGEYKKRNCGNWSKKFEKNIRAQLSLGNSVDTVKSGRILRRRTNTRRFCTFSTRELVDKQCEGGGGAQRMLLERILFIQIQQQTHASGLILWGG